ncbi:aminotransferase class I/II-fold pyridoxal phosphate-dependent enzyme [Planctomicrobium sp. SH664]|uniref:aminotransferase class I/II-fold pyridoxal phosphate-dependent enzyme n=1 Tax=Planctomicrobium sp. SH664 TaxID=3448125 RepID=UPI003F5C835E
MTSSPDVPLGATTSGQPDPLHWLQQGLEGLSAAHLRRRQRNITPLPHGRCLSDGQELWNFAGNDYLGLAEDPRVISAAQEALQSGGIGARASALVTGRTIWHDQLEQSLCRLKSAERALLFPSGYAANVGVLTALAGPEDVIYCDRLNHASLIDGCRLSRATFRVYPHNDLIALHRELQRGPSFRRRFVVTDSLFSMDGDAAPLAELIELVTRNDALLIVDEAHATGTCGDKGSGLLEGLLSDPVTARRVVSIGTLSKAIGSQGGFVTGSHDLCEWLWNSARTQLFSTALAIPSCAAATAALKMIEEEPQRREWLAAASVRVQTELRQLGWQVPENLVGPIIPLIVGDPDLTVQLAGQLEQLGLLVAAIRPPTVPHGTSRLRISLSYAHGDEGVEAILRTFSDMPCRAASPL